MTFNIDLDYSFTPPPGSLFDLARPAGTDNAGNPIPSGLQARNAIREAANTWESFIKNSPTKPRPFIQLAYGYLPLVLGANLAHYLRLFLNEAGRILPFSFATFGLDGSSLPIFIAHPAVVSFL
jgi:hypothetical protein